MRKINIAIFVSGSGTNCENLIRYFTDSPRVNCALVVSNKADAFALERAKRLNVPTAVTPKAQLNDILFMRKLLQDYRIDFIQHPPRPIAQVWRQGHVGSPCA